MRILNKEMLTAHGNRKGRKIVAELLDAGMDALDPYVRVKKLVRLENNRIILDDRGFEMRGDPHAGPAVYDLKDYDRVFVVGAAKGVQRAALAMEEALGDALTGGHVIAKHGEEKICKKIGVTFAGHPVPDARGDGHAGADAPPAHRRGKSGAGGDGASQQSGGIRRGRHERLECL